MSKKKAAVKENPKKVETGLRKAERPDGPGIRELVWVEAGCLRDNPKNWRMHPPEQVEGLRQTLKDNGWAGTLLYNERTGNLVDGHARKNLCAEVDPATPVPVLVGDWTEEQEASLLFTLDPLASLAKADDVKYKALQKEVSLDLHEQVERMSAAEQEAAKVFEELVESMPKLQTRMEKAAAPTIAAVSAAPPPPPDPSDGGIDAASDRLGMVHDLQENMVFEYGQPFDIPNLRNDMLCPPVDQLVTWLTPDSGVLPSSGYAGYYYHVISNGNTRTLPWDRTIICTHTSDDYLEPLWFTAAEKTKKLLNRRVYAAAAPEFSCSSGPRAARIWNVYRSRWIGRYWQEAGIRVVPTIPHVEKRYESDAEYFFAGIPQFCPMVSVQLQANDHHPVEFSSEQDADVEFDEAYYRFSLQCMASAIKPETLIVYGGPKRDSIIKLAKLPKNIRVISVENFITARGRILKERTKKNEGSAT